VLQPDASKINRSKSERTELGRNSLAAHDFAARPMPKRPSEFSQLWHEVLKPWVWPILTIALLIWAIFKQGAEAPFDTALFAALSGALLMIALVDRDNAKALRRLVDWEWMALGLGAVWLVMALQFLPLPYLSGGGQIWAKADMVTVDPDLTLRAMVGMGSAVAFFVLGAIFGADRSRREIVLLLLALAMLPILFQAFDSYNTKVALFDYQAQKNGARMEGTFLNANTFAILMVMFFACSVGVFVAEFRRYKGRERLAVKIIALLAAAATAFCIYLTMSRAAWLLSFAILFSLALLIRPASRGQISVFGALILLVMLMIWNSAEQLGLPIRPLNFGAGVDGRLLDWRPGFDLTMMRPWMGWGAGTFARVMEPVRDVPIAASSIIIITPQNSLLLITSETGIVGLLAWTLLAIGLVRYSVNGLRIRSASVVLAAALILAAAATFVQSLFDFPMSIPVISALWAFFLGYAGGLGGKTPPKVSKRTRKSNKAS